MTVHTNKPDPARDLLSFARDRKFATILADPPWRFVNRTGKTAPEHRRLSRYGTLTVAEIAVLPVPQILLPTAHLYLWVPNALLPEALHVLHAWGFAYKSNIVWHKLRKDGGSDGRGVGFYFRNVTELILFGIRGMRNARARAATGELRRHAQERAFTEAGRTVRHHPSVQPATLSGTVCARPPRRMGPVGTAGRRMLCTDVGNLSLQFPIRSAKRGEVRPNVADLRPASATRTA